MRKRPARDRNRAYIWEAKDKPCADCRKRYPPWVMQFDHVRGRKLGNISRMAMAGESSLQRIQAEINKCEVVCSNCHANRTHFRRRIAASGVTRYNPHMDSLVIYSFVRESGMVVFATSPDGPWFAGDESQFIPAMLALEGYA